MEEPVTRWSDGVDTSDQALDVWVEADRTWRIKDEDEFVERIGHPLFWTADQAAKIRAEADRVIHLIDSGAFPFDGTWCDFMPLPSWRRPALLPTWSAPRAYTDSRIDG